MLIWDNEILRTLGGIYSAREVARPCHTTTAAVSCVKYVWFSFMVVIITLKSPLLHRVRLAQKEVMFPSEKVVRRPDPSYP